MSAQPDLFEVSLGYNYIRVTNDVIKDFHGFDLSAFVNVNSWLALGGEFMAGYSTNSARLNFFQTVDSEDRYIYVFGPRLSYWPTKKLRLFGEALAGAAHADADVSSNFGRFTQTASADAFALALGGGTDWCFTRHWSWRILEANYLPTHFHNQWQDKWRLSTGIVYTFGGRE
ncbi:MAG TPA: outer membrane beta-barrel protein [Chthoniobacterales bacterium]|nr:outer membrane beta-barrel protein [Chthoniobacterales bacterium]